MPQPYDTLNKGWKSTCKVLFGEELGELKDYADWLREYLPPSTRKKSCISGKPVTLTMDYYCPTAKFISADEVKEKAIEPLTINEVKDIDSIVEAVGGKWEYAGNKILGNSAFVESSDLVIDSQYVADSVNIQQSAYVFASSLIRKNSKYVYGSSFFGEGEFVVRTGFSYNIKRLFESHVIGNSRDLYYCFSCYGCGDLLFSFFQRNKRHCIGNLQLPKDKYLSLKRKLLSELAGELKREKRLPSLTQLVPDARPKGAKLDIQPRKTYFDIGPIERAFSKTFKVIFKSEAEGLDEYGRWLSRRTVPIREIKTPFGRTTYMPENIYFPIFLLMPKKRLVTTEEGLELGRLHLSENDVSSLGKIRERLQDIGYFTAEWFDGVNTNAAKSPVLHYGSHAYKTYDVTHGEYAGICSLALNSKYTFGCYRILDSDFCIKCYNSLYLSRCYEVDVSTKCADSLFCHNCEGLSDAMFCFNVKGKRHAIGNTELAPGKYREIKDSVIEQIADELGKKKDFKWDIFKVGCGRA